MLYDNNTPDLLLTDEPAQPRIIARKDGMSSHLWSEPEPYRRFLEKAKLETAATCAKDLYPPAPLSPDYTNGDRAETPLDRFRAVRSTDDGDGHATALTEWLKDQLFGRTPQTPRPIA